MRSSLKNMLKDWGLALGITVGVFAAWGWLRGGPATEGPAPDFVLADTAGTEVSLDALRGQTVVLNFWATWCGPCRQEIPEFAAFHEDHPQVAMYGINVDEGASSAKIAAISKRLGVNYTVLMDPGGATSRDYGVNGLPTTFVLDGEGHITAAREGTVSRRTLQRMTGF